MKILISIDNSSSADIVLTAAKEYLIGFPEAEMHILTVIDVAMVASGDDLAETLVMDNLEHHANELVSRATSILGERSFILSHETGSPVNEIMDKISTLPADLLIIGTHGRTGLVDHLLMGSVAERVLSKATCPTLIIPIKRKKEEV